jgi:hypothetical protein
MVNMEILDKLYEHRFKLLLIPALFVIVGFFSPLFLPSMENNIIVSFIIAILSFVIIWAFEFLFEAFLGKSKNFHDENFGYFSTKIYNDFEDKWIESSYDSELNLPNCKMKIFTNEIQTYANIEQGKDYQYSTLTENVYKVYYQRKNVIEFFKIYYMEFNTKEEYDSNINLIKENFKGKNGGVDHFSSDNIHIVFHVVAEYSNGEVVYFKNKDGWRAIARRAAKFVKLN